MLTCRHYGDRTIKPINTSLIVGIMVGALACCIFFAALGQRQSGDGGAGGVAARVIKVAHSLPTSHPVHRGIEEFGRELEQRSGGQMTVQIFPSSQLGNEVEMLEKIQQGSIDVAKVSAAPIGSFVEDFKVFSLPYLFRNYDHFWSILDGEIGQQLLLDLTGGKDDSVEAGMIGLTYYDAGSRSFYTTNPVNSPEDLKGLKIRVQSDPVAIATVKAIGASPVAISFGELYGVLQQGGVDGAENNPPSFFSTRHFEICKYYILDEHSRIPDVLIASKKLWASLSPEQRTWFKQSADQSSIFQRNLWAEETETAMNELKAAGVTVVEADNAAFQALVGDVTKEFATGTREVLVDRIQAVQ